tara:strand:+ start:338 stop:943 length:606 start_codon:yes stop_codon:yes gene_type:complete
MHKLNVLILGPASFVSTLNELKLFLKFNPLTDTMKKDYDIVLFHNEALKDKENKSLIDNCKKIKICVGGKRNKQSNYDGHLDLPTTLKEINFLVENIFAKKKFNINSSIEVKNYILDKNEKKLSKLNNFIFLTEKEVQLIELFINYKKPVSKDNILSSVWNYSAEADTHTVETHIYRLRKKILEKFMDEKFILNNKEGYYL